MNIDPGLAVIIVAVLIFYLRLIIIQRERIRRARLQNITAAKNARKKNKNAQPPAVRYAILSQNKADWIIAGSGALLIVLGILLNLKVLPLAWAQSFWWLPVALGIVAFSWGFK